MLFNSLVFVVFFVVVWCLYQGPPPRLRRPLLLVASYVFFSWIEWWTLFVLLGSTATAYVCGLALDSPRRGNRGRWLAAGVVVNLALLFTFKYIFFFAVETNSLLRWLDTGRAIPLVDLFAPLGLSFFTLQSISYIVDVSRGTTRACRDPLDLALFISFFPQLVAGPIERANHLLPQLHRLGRPTPQQLALGAQLLLWGYYKKLFVADNLATLVAPVFDNPAQINWLMLTLACYAFAWQIYCDFSGYTDIARGLASMLGVQLVDNFRLPYFAASPAELWQRWHISLSSWFRDYLYIPLGGSRGGRWRYLVSIFVTMVLAGLWHGAYWTYMLWGAYHGLLLVIHRLLPRSAPSRWRKALGVIVTFHLTCLGYILFRAHDVNQIWQLFAGLTFDAQSTRASLANLPDLLVPVHLVLVIELALRLTSDNPRSLWRTPRWAQAALAALLTLSICLLGSTYGLQFIYFQF